MDRIAWFSPLPPSTSGIAAYSAELLPLLAARGLAIDTFTDATAHDFVWMHRRRQYALTVFQMGNARAHDFMWAYLFRYPGLVVLHDAQVHQARALFLTKRWKPRRAHYLAEFRASHPETPPDTGELIAAGLGGTLYQHWPLTRLLVDSARTIVVHNARLADDLRRQHPAVRINAVEMGVGAVPGVASSARREALRTRHGIPADAILLAAFGGITPEKRIPQIIRALSAMADRHPTLHLMLVGALASHYDVRADARAWGVSERVHVTGYVPDADLPEYLLEADACLCLRWPTNRETSASWLRCLAAGRATIITELAHLADVPTIDPRGWRVLSITPGEARPVAVSIDLLDEDHSLQLALERLATDVALRSQLGVAARAWWHAHHRLEPMADAYVRIIADAMRAPAPRVPLPPHLVDDGSGHAMDLAGDVGIQGLVAEILRN